MHIDSIEVFHVALPLERPQEIAGRPLRPPWKRSWCGWPAAALAGWGEASPGNAPWPAANGPAAPSPAPRLAGPGRWPARAIDSAERRWPSGWRRSAATGSPRPPWTPPGGTSRPGSKASRCTSCSAAAGRPVEVGADLRPHGVDRRFPGGHRPGARTPASPAWSSSSAPAGTCRCSTPSARSFPPRRSTSTARAALRLEHMEMLCRLDDFSLAMIEQPLPADDLVGHAMVQEAIRTPVCLDEGITTLAQAEMALDLHSCRLRQSQAGPGRRADRRAGDPRRLPGRRHWLLGRRGAAKRHRPADRPGPGRQNAGVYPADYFPAEEVLDVNLAEPARASRDPADGRMRVPLWSTPGLGIEPDGDILQKHSLQVAHHAGRAESHDSGPA